VVVAGAAALAGFAVPSTADPGPLIWTRNEAPNTVNVSGGPWTLEQSGAANGLKSSGYCASADGVHGTEINNPGTERMQPYYFPFVVGQGSNLQGFFDWRPKDTDEAVVSASSNDNGKTWVFQDKVLELTTQCPTNPNTEGAEKEKDAVCQGPDAAHPLPCQNASNDQAGGVGDDGQGHQFILNISGQTLLYTLNRSNGHIDSDPLVIHVLSPTPGHPLAGAPLLDDGPTDANPALPEPALHTTGLIDPDGILGVVPDSNPLTIIYEEKILNGDNTGATALPNAQVCDGNGQAGVNTGWQNYYNNIPAGINTGGISANHDITFLRLASTTDGFNFTDLGPLQGLNDPTTVSATGTRWLATAGSILKLERGRYGLLFSGGSCIDGDSDAFHFIGYAESTDLIHWNVVNGFNNPIASVFPVTINVDANGVPIVPPAAGNSITIPSTEPVVGDTQGFFAGRVYAPSATQSDAKDVTVIFAGYHTTKPKNGLGDYRTIVRVSLHASEDIREIGANGEVRGGGQDQDHDQNSDSSRRR
jgi:hypothetical protein